MGQKLRPKTKMDLYMKVIELTEKESLKQHPEDELAGVAMEVEALAAALDIKKERIHELENE